jgi:hypothetical protein
MPVYAEQVLLNGRSIPERAMESLRRCGNPFRNYFARNPDDEVCSRYHVPELYAKEREQLLAVIDLYRYDPTTHSEVVPILGNKGAGKTHLLHSIKHGPSNGWQLLVTPGTYQKGTEFPEYVLFQIIDTLLGGGKQRGKRPIEFVGEELTRRLLKNTLEGMDLNQRMELFPTPALGKWVRKLGLGSAQAEERTQWLIDLLSRPTSVGVKKACQEATIDVQKTYEAICQYVERTENRNTAGMMRRRIHQGFAKFILLGDESELASFMTDGFAGLDFQVRPNRQDMVLALLKVLMEIFLSLKVPVVVAFDQLEDLLLVRRTEDGHKVSESFFAGIVQLMHQVDGICFLIFAERGLWNRFVPSLDGYIQDRLNNPVHVPKFGTIKALRLEAPPPQMVWQVVAARLRPALEEVPDFQQLSGVFPFNEEQVNRIAKTEPTLRDMLQQFRHLFDHLAFGQNNATAAYETTPLPEGARELPPPEKVPVEIKDVAIVETPVEAPIAEPAFYKPANDEVPQPPAVNRIRDLEEMFPTASPENAETELGAAILEKLEAALQSLPPPVPMPEAPSPKLSLTELWAQEIQAARAKLEPEGALTGATREMQSGLGAFLQLCHEHGVKVGPWRLMHVVPELTFGEHPTYGVMTIAHWAGKDGQPWRLGLGLFLGRGPGKPKDLQAKLGAFHGEPCVIDQLILLRPSDDTTLTGKSKTLWEEADKSGRTLRLEPMDLEGFAVLYGFPRWLTAVTESLAEGQPLPNLADFLQEKCLALLEQLCMPVAKD